MKEETKLESKFRLLYVLGMAATYAIGAFTGGYFYSNLNSTYKIIEKSNGWERNSKE